MPVCWGITPGNAGMVAQVKALVEALGLDAEMKNTQLRPLLAWLPNRFILPLCRWIPPCFLTQKLSPPWPDIVISCGRRGAAVALWLKAVAPQVRVIHIQDPHIDARHFDAVVAMEHDAIAGPNVIKMRFALHAVTPAKLAADAEKFAPRFAGYYPPRVAVLLGGSTNRYTLRGYAMEQLLLSLQRFQESTSASLLITPSRRTGEKNTAMLMMRFRKNDRVFVYAGDGENPYPGLLAVADSIVVTNDSVNMMSEAHATGKPLYILPLPGHAGTKPARFAESLIAGGIARPLGDKCETWSYPADNEMQRVAAEIKALLRL